MRDVGADVLGIVEADSRRAERFDFIAIIGDLNDTPETAQLRALPAGTSLQDVFRRPSFDTGSDHACVFMDFALS